MRQIISSTIFVFLITNSVLCEAYQDQVPFEMPKEGTPFAHDDSLRYNPDYSEDANRYRIMDQSPQDVLKFLETLSRLGRTTMLNEKDLADPSNRNGLRSTSSELMIKRDKFNYYKCYFNPVSCFRK